MLDATLPQGGLWVLWVAVLLASGGQQLETVL